jgi:hypothetical protein
VVQLGKLQTKGESKGALKISFQFITGFLILFLQDSIKALRMYDTDNRHYLQKLGNVEYSCYPKQEWEEIIINTNPSKYRMGKSVWK